MQHIYHSPMRPLWLGFGSTIGQPYAAHEYAGKPNAFKTVDLIAPALVESLELVALPHDGSPDVDWLVDAYQWEQDKIARRKKKAEDKALAALIFGSET